MKRTLLFSTVLGLLTVGASLAVPLTNCTLNAGAGFTCNVYESVDDPTNADPTVGIPSEISDVFTLPGLVEWGYVVLLDNLSNQTDISTWSDVLHFIQNGATGAGNTLRMFSVGCNVAAGNRSCFQPAYTDVTVNSAPVVFLLENPNGIGNDFTDFTVFPAAPNTYNIYSASEVAAVPEPATLALLGAGLIGIAVLARKRSAKR